MLTIKDFFYLPHTQFSYEEGHPLKKNWRRKHRKVQVFSKNLSEICKVTFMQPENHF